MDRRMHRRIERRLGGEKDRNNNDRRIDRMIEILGRRIKNKDGQNVGKNAG